MKSATIRRSFPLALFVMATSIILNGQQAYANNCGYPSDNQAIIFKDADRGGPCRVLEQRNYPNPSSFSPVPNDQVSSLDVGSDSRVVLSEDANFRKHQAYFDGGWFYNLAGTDVDNMTSAVEVFPAAGGPMAAWDVGDYPSNARPFWAEGVQGIAHDDRNWFIAQTKTLFKKPLSEQLDNDVVALNPVGIPPDMVKVGYNHFGDLDQAYGHLFVPVQGKKNGNAIAPALAVFNAADLSFVGWQPIPQLPSSGGAWVAYRWNTGTLFFSDGDVSKTQPLYEYSLRFVTHSNNPVRLTFIRKVYLFDRQNVPVTINTTQGGVFNSSGTLLYVVNGYCNRDEGAINVFNLDTETTTGLGTLQARSENGFGPFNFEHHGGSVCDEEPEGMDFFDTTGSDIPGVPDSQLHVLLLRNALGDDGVYVKHYSY